MCSSVWTAVDCPSQMVCVPSHNSTNICSCEFTTLMLVDQDDGSCKISTFTIVYCCYWLLHTVGSIMIFLFGLNTIFRFSKARIKNSELMRIGALAATAAAGASIGVGLSNSIRFLFTSRTLAEKLDLLWFVATLLTSFAIACSLLLVGFNLLVTFVFAATLRDTRKQKHKLIILSIISAIVLVAGSAPLNFYAMYAIAGAYLSFWAFAIWGVFWQVSRGAKMFVKLVVPSSTAQSLKHRLSSIRTQTNRVMLSVVTFNLGTIGYIFFYFFGTAYRSRLLLGLLSAIATVIQGLGVITTIGFMNLMMARIVVAKIRSSFERSTTRDMIELPPNRVQEPFRGHSNDPHINQDVDPNTHPTTSARYPNAQPILA
eukprot:c14345_g1_i1.p1 GENE.c14345_g1_i1~~c14345_g1_i1.p1  ORF type:complete len:388 (-),score=49.19 c14345_g1_i1:48-1163(-)